MSRCFFKEFMKTANFGDVFERVLANTSRDFSDLNLKQMCEVINYCLNSSIFVTVNVHDSFF